VDLGCAANLIFFSLSFNILFMTRMHFIFLFLLTSFVLRALEPGKTITQYNVQVWNMESGLPGNSVLAVRQTQEGYLWIGTQDGLVRFDGLHLQLFSREKIPQLKDNTIRALYQDRNGTLWIGTSSGGLTSYREGNFTTYPVSQHKALYNISAIAEDRWGNLWIGSITGGLTCLSHGHFTTYTDNSGLPHNRVRSIYKDGNADLWVTTAAAILKLLEPGSFQVYAPQSRLPYFKTVCLYEEDTDTLWIGTGGGGLFRLKNGGLTAYGVEAGIPHPTITYLFKDRMKSLWIGTDGGGLTRLSRGIFSTLGRGDGLDDGYVYSINEDREGSLWVGTLDGGLHQLRDGKFTTYTTREGLSHDYVECLYESRTGDLWIGTKVGLNRLESKTGIINAARTGRPGILSSMVLCLFEDPAGGLWIGTWQGLHRLKDGKLAIFTKRDGLSDNRIICISGDNAGNTWIGTRKGLNRCNAHNGQFTIFTTNDGLSSNHIVFIFPDSNGNLLIGTDAGLNCLRDGIITTYKRDAGRENKFFRCAYRDSRGTLWFGTKGGLIRMPPGEKACTFTVQSGLIVDDIYSILEDESGYLWLSGRNGISRVMKQGLADFAAGKILRVQPETFNEQDGMKSRWCTGSVVKTRDGRLWFPTSVGVTMIDPNHIKRNLLPPPLMIEKIIVDGEPIKIKKFTGGSPAVPTYKSIELAPGKKRLEFYYTAVGFINPGRTKFKLKLEGFDSDWIDMGTSRSTTYTGLSPGDYIFRVTACNPDGVWNEKGVSFSFYLQPHWYRTWWAFSLYVLTVFLGVFFFVKGRSAKLEKEKKRLEQMVKERTVEINRKNLQLLDQSEKLKEMGQVKSRFFANISHEFRTPLTLIKGPLEEILAENPDKKLEARANMMLRNSCRLLDLVNQLLELAKFDSGIMKLHAARQNIVPFVKNIVMCFESLALHNEIDLTFQAEVDDILLYFDPGKMERILTNLLSNAFNYTAARGKIRVAIQKVIGTASPGGCVEILVGDTGIGIPADCLPHIFDRFYRGEGEGGNESRAGGTGIGLALVRELVELHYGEIEVHSSCRPDHTRGTEFILRLPMGKAHLQAEEIVAAVEDKQKFLRGGPGGAVFSKSAPPNRESVPQTRRGQESNKQEQDKPVILVVDDNADVRAYIRGALESRFNIEEAANGQEGIDKAGGIMPDLVISDIMMPGPDGFELCACLKKDIKTSHIPIVLLTAKASETSIVQGLETGADDYIVKPFNAHILVSRVTNLIRLRRQLQEKIQAEMVLQPGEISVSSLDEKFIKEMQAKIEENLSDPEFSVEQLANGLYMSKSSLYRKVEALTGESPQFFIRSYRLKRAAQLLRAKAGNVTEVAFNVGFSNTSYFSKCFKEKFHRLPSDY
jgi:ligand-binding sensor domain-containing protein/signal transduction histidine kinase/DNA-binding response OmpR family regulator